MENLSPNIRKTVLWLQENGFKTTDSGDGTNFEEGMECSLPFPHVFMEIDPLDMISEALRLKELVYELNHELVPDIQANYSPYDGKAFLMLSNASDIDLF